MNTDLSRLYPQKLWEYFAGISEIPRSTGHEEKITKFVQQFGIDLGLETIVDKVGNVVIRKPATQGFENLKGVILQSHLDMISQKAPDVTHDFEKDPIQAYIDNEWVKANGTTLGADNGIAVAATMAILQSKDIPHGPIEALFTVGEEFELTGAGALSKDILKHSILLNLDNETEGDLVIGSGGGIYTVGKIKFQALPCPAKDFKAYTLDINGLEGGHSGLFMHLHLGNAIKILGDILFEAAKIFDLRLSSINGGELPNSIPCKANAVVTIPKTKEADFKIFIEDIFLKIKQEFIYSDSNLKINLTAVELPKFLIDEESQNSILAAIVACPDGVFRMSANIPNLVETSTNLAKISQEDNVVEILTRQRSLILYQQERLASMVKCVFELAKVEISQYGFFPAWSPDIQSQILAVAKKVYLEKFQKDSVVTAVHAGSECGIIKNSYPKMEIISFGPTIVGAHSINEKVNIASVGKFWDFLIAILKNIPSNNNRGE